MNTIGIRREDKSIWERRVPLTPDAVNTLVNLGSKVIVQPSERRIFTDDEFRRAGAEIEEDLDGCDVVFGVKEMPIGFFRQGGVYLFFSHTVKGQDYNMPLLREMVDRRIDLIDYEKIIDADGRRLVLFSRFAGLAGMIDSLAFYGRRLEAQGKVTPLVEIEPSHAYGDLEEAKRAVRGAGDAIRFNPIPGGLICGFAGYGNVSQGAQEIFDLLEPETIEPGALAEANPAGAAKVVFREEHMVRPREAGASFALQDYYDHPEKYEGNFEQYLSKLDLLINGIYWEDRYPRLVTCDWVRREWESGGRKPALIADISCDVEGSVECLVRPTDPGDPVYVWEPDTGETVDGVSGNGPTILAVEILPCELPREASMSFSDSLVPFLESIARCDFNAPEAAIDLPQPLREALILRRGEFTEKYEYMASFLK